MKTLDNENVEIGMDIFSIYTPFKALKVEGIKDSLKYVTVGGLKTSLTVDLPPEIFCKCQKNAIKNSPNLFKKNIDEIKKQLEEIDNKMKIILELI